MKFYQSVINDGLVKSRPWPNRN